MTIKERPLRGLVEIIDKVIISGAEKNQKLGLAKKLESLNQLSKIAGVGTVYVFEHEEELKNEIIKSCHLSLNVGYDSKIYKLSLRRKTEQKLLEYPVNINLGKNISFECIPGDLHWLTKTVEYASVPTMKGFNITDDIVTVSAPLDGQLYIERKILAEMMKISKEDILPKDVELPAMPRACFVISSGKFYTESPTKLRTAELIKCRPQRKDVSLSGHILGYYISNEDYVEDSETEFLDASLIFDSYESLITHELNMLNSEVDINLVPNIEHQLISRLNSSIQRLCISRFKIETQVEKLTQEEIYKLIGRYFDALIDSPWDGETNGMYADLKELCKKSYKNLHIWSNNIKGYYGFKIKNRNHKWIVGEIYCPVDALAPSSNQTIPEVFFEKRDGRYEQRSRGWGSITSFPFRYEGDIVSVGPCKFYIGCTI